MMMNGMLLFLDLQMVIYFLDPDSEVLAAWIEAKAHQRYQQLKSQAYKVFLQWVQDGRAYFPYKFVGREQEWDWLISHFDTESFEKLSKEMSRVRGLKKMDHISGPKTYGDRLDEVKDSKAPHMAEGSRRCLVSFEKLYGKRRGKNPIGFGSLVERPAKKRVVAASTEDAANAIQQLQSKVESLQNMVDVLLARMHSENCQQPAPAPAPAPSPSPSPAPSPSPSPAVSPSPS